MSTRPSSRICSFAVCVAFATPWPDIGTAGADEPATAEVEDVLEEVLQQNSRTPPPPERFETPHAQPIVPGVRVRRRGTAGHEIDFRNGERLLTPAVDKNRLFVGGGFGSHLFYCFDLGAGRAQWGVRLSDPGPSAVSYNDGVVVVNTESCTTYAFEADTGDLMWAVWLGDPVVSTPTVAGGRVFVSYPHQPWLGDLDAPMTPPADSLEISYVLAALDLQSGRMLWRRHLDQEVMSAPVAASDALYVSTFAGTVYKFAKSNGRILMARRCGATSAPVVMGDGIYLTRFVGAVRDGRHRVCVSKLDRLTGDLVYSVAHSETPSLAHVVPQPGQRLETPQASPAADQPNQASSRRAGGMRHATFVLDVSTQQEYSGARLLAADGALFTCAGHVLRRIDASSGETRWTVDLPKPVAETWVQAPFPPVVAGGRLFVVTCRNTVLRVDPATGGVLQTYDVGEPVSSEPAVSGGYLWVATRTGKIVRIATGDSRFTGWHQAGGNSSHTGTEAGFVDPYHPDQPTGRVAQLLAEFQRQQRPILLTVSRRPKDAPSEADAEAYAALLGEQPGGDAVETNVLNDPRIQTLVPSFHVIDVSLQDVLALICVIDRDRLDTFYRKRVHFAVINNGGDLLSLVSSDDGTTLHRVLARALQRSGLAVPMPTETAASNISPIHVDSEQRATGLLRIAQNLMAKNPEAAAQRLERIVEEYPESNAARTARRLLRPSPYRGN